jgi:PAS domain S-box-containing protein
MTRPIETNSEAPRLPRERAEASLQDRCADLSRTVSEEVGRYVRGLETLREQISATAGFIRGVDERNRPGHSLLQLEHRLLRFEQAIRSQLAFEKFLFDLSRTFIGLPEEEIDANMERGLAHVGEFLQVDRVTLLELSPSRTELSVIYSWSAAGVPAPPQAITRRDQPWWVGQVLSGEVSLASGVDALPDQAVAEKEYFRKRGVASAASIPLKVGGEIAGAISFITIRRHVSWTPELVNQLRAIGHILWNALRRRQAMQSLLAAQGSVRDSDERFRLAMNNVAAGVYTLDLSGRVTYVNPAAEAMFGWTNAELVGKQMHDVTHGRHPDGTPYPAAECPALQVLQNGIEHREHEDTFIRKDGRFFPVVLSASPLQSDGTTVGVVVGFRDDTLRREAEHAIGEREALRASEERYRGLAEQSVDGIVITDARVHALDGNQAACDLFGCTLEELKTLAADDVLTAEELPSLPGQLQRLANGEVVRSEWRFKRRDGSVFLGEAIGRQLPDGRLQIVLRDITEHKQIEEMQRSLLKLTKLTLNTASLEEVLGAVVETAIVLSHADFGNIQLVVPNSSTLHMAAQRGFPKWWIDYWEVTAAGHGVSGTALERGERVVVEDVEESPILSGQPLEMYRRAGVRAMQSTPLVARSGQVIGMLSTHFKERHSLDARSLLSLDLLAREAADIIQHVQAEGEMRRQAALLDLAHDSIFVRDHEGRITYWNEGAARIYGWSKEEALGQVSHKLLQTRFPVPLEQIVEIVRSTGHWEGEIVHVSRDARRITMESRWAIQRDVNDDSFSILEINKDITERKRLEEERAEENRRKDEFLAFLGHELRNPLAAIHTAVQVLSKGATPARRATMEDIIGRQTALTRRLVDDLLDLERITHGHIELKQDRVELAECLRRAVAGMQSTVDSRRQELLVELPAESVQFMADPARLDQIVSNLLSNASKYSGSGGRIELSGAREGSEVVIRCKDNGQGILPDYQQKIFEPFVRGPSTASSYGEASLGLGLALVKHLTELHGGTISVESGGAGLGSEFTVRFPLISPSGRAVVDEPKPAASPHRLQSIVIVEDNPSVGVALKVALEQAGHSVHLFADAPSTLAGVLSLKPDAFLIDISLPGLDGYELATKLKQQSHTKNAVRIAVSGLRRRQSAEDAPDAFDYYFTKPVDIPELLALLNQG